MKLDSRDLKQFKIIFLYEYMGVIKNKVYIITTVIIVLIIASLLTVPSIISKFSNKDKDVKPVPLGSAGKVVVIDNTGVIPIEVFSTGLPMYKFESSEKNIEDLKESVKNEELYAVIQIKTPLEFDYYAYNYGITDTMLTQISDILTYNYKTSELIKQGLSQEESLRILGAQTNGNLIDLGKNFEQSFLYAYVLLMLLYISVNIYGQTVATSVATEKSSRAMELLISSAKPLNFMFGKIIGSGLAGLTQLISIMGVSLGFYKLNESYWGKYPIIGSLFNMPVDIFLYTILFFLLGYFLYSFIYGAVGSLVNRVEDINSSILPVTFLFMAGFMVSMFSLYNPSGTLIKVFSYIPFFSPMCMFLRICMTSVPVIQIIISVILLLITIVFIGYLSARIYRIGVLMYGKPPKIKELISVLKRKD